MHILTIKHLKDINLDLWIQDFERYQEEYIKNDFTEVKTIT